MRGGTWGYSEWLIKSATEQVANPNYSTAPEDLPKLINVIELLGETLYDIIHQLDWHYACETTIDNCRIFENTALQRLQGCLDSQSQNLQPPRRPN